MLIGKKLQGGFTLIELIASMVLMAIMLPSVGLLVVNSMRAIATHNVSLQASVDGGYVQNNFTKHLRSLLWRTTSKGTQNQLPCDTISRNC